MADTFHCTLVTPQQQVLDEPVKYVSIPAYDGQMGIAPGRAPLVAKLAAGSLRLETGNGTSKQFFLAGGFAQMKDNRLTVLSEDARPAEELNLQAAKQALETALAVKAVGEEQTLAKWEQVAKARAMVSMAAASRKA